MGLENFLFADTQDAEEHLILERICEILQAPSIMDFSILQWNSTNRATPDPDSYVIIMQYDPEEGVVCSPASYERGEFWDNLNRLINKIDRDSVIAWSYLPYDDRITPSGKLRRF